MAKPAKKLTSGTRTREWLRKLGYRVECVESLQWGGSKKDFLGFIDDIAFYGDYMIGIQSCLSTDLDKHRAKFAELVSKNAIITNWMACAELWLVWWTDTGYNGIWHPSIEILNPALEVKRRPNAVLQLVK